MQFYTKMTTKDTLGKKLDQIESSMDQKLDKIEQNNENNIPSEQTLYQDYHYIEFEKKSTIYMLKYIFNEETDQFKKFRLNIIKINELNEELDEETDIDKIKISEVKDSPIPSPEDTYLLKKSKFDITEINQKIFKKISISFKVLKQLLTILLLYVDDKQYQEIKNNEVKFPKDIENLSIIVGTFNKAFNREIQEKLYEIVNFPHYSDFMSIAEVNNLLIPFVADNSIKTDVLIDDFIKFSQLIKDLACEVLNVNINFEPHIFE